MCCCVHIVRKIAISITVQTRIAQICVEVSLCNNCAFVFFRFARRYFALYSCDHPDSISRLYTDWIIHRCNPIFMAIRSIPQWYQVALFRVFLWGRRCERERKAIFSAHTHVAISLSEIFRNKFILSFVLSYSSSAGSYHADRTHSMYYPLREEEAAMRDSDVASAGWPNIRGASASRRAASRPPFLHRFNCRAPRLRSTSSGLFRSLSRTYARARPSPCLLFAVSFMPSFPLSVSLPLSHCLVFFICLRSLVRATPRTRLGWASFQASILPLSSQARGHRER